MSPYGNQKKQVSAFTYYVLPCDNHFLTFSNPFPSSSTHQLQPDETQKPNTMKNKVAHKIKMEGTKLLCKERVCKIIITSRHRLSLSREEKKNLLTHWPRFFLFFKISFVFFTCNHKAMEQDMKRKLAVSCSHETMSEYIPHTVPTCQFPQKNLERLGKVNSTQSNDDDHVQNKRLSRGSLTTLEGNALSTHWQMAGDFPFQKIILPKK